MKQLAVALAVINLALLAWFLTAPPTPAPHTDAISSGDRLVLLAELAPDKRPAPRAAMVEEQLPAGVELPPEKDEPFPEVPTQAIPATPAVHCFHLAGYPDEKSALRAKGALEKNGAKVGGPNAQHVERSRYWVLLPPFATQAQAQAAIERLRKAGVKDYYLIPNGENRNALSLGVFSTREAARRRMNDVAHLKLKVRVEEVRFPTRHFALDLEWSGTPAPNWQGLLPPGIEVQPKECVR